MALLIRAGRVRSTRSHPNRNVQGEDAAKRILQRGIARTALRHRLEAPAVDIYGNPMRHATAMANGYSLKGLSRLASQSEEVTGTYLVTVGCRGCETGKAAWHSWPCPKASR